MSPESSIDEMPVDEGQSPPRFESISSLVQDWVVRGVLVAVAIAAVPILIPVLSDDWRETYGHHLLDLPFLGVVLVAIRYRLRGVKERRERRFWNLLTFGFACWLGALLISAASIDLWFESRTVREFVKNGPYLLFYGAVAAALEIHAHVRSDPLTHRLRALNQVGSFVLLFGLMAYFLVLPGLSSTDSSTVWASSLALFVSLDVYIVLRLWYLRGSATGGEWRTIYTGLAVGATLWGLGDLGLSLMYEGVLTGPGWGTPFDLIWPLAFVAVVVATRASTETLEQLPLAPPVRQPLGMGPLVLYAVVPLLLHVSLYRFGVPDPGLRPARGLLVLGVTGLLGALALGYHRVLRVENRRLNKEEALAKEKFAHLAFHDDLTGLPNRNLFRDHFQLALAHSTRYQRKCAVLFCDLDQFKVINDSLGHEAGDQALVAISERLRSSVRRIDTVARFGGDEFTIILQGIRQSLDAAVLAEKLLAALSEPLVVGGKKHVLTASIGIAIFPDDGTDEETLFKHADTAMYQAKLHGRNTYRLFTEAMNEAAEERLAIEQGLRAGLMDEKFTVFYQPIIEIATDQVVGYEALLRWNHPERGFVTPVNFIDIAEQTGLIVPIGKWVLETACAWAAQIDSPGVDPPSIAVNLSLRQLREPGLAQEVKEILERTGLDPSRLQLEITESMALTLDSTGAELGRLRDLGVRIAIDDFGTGYAALSRLRDLPVDIVKVDGSFVKGIEVDSVSEAIVLAIVNMARALDFYVVAEGVETEAEMEVIRKSQCDAAQGFFLCAPMPPEELEEAMARR